uniref:cytochrome c oxidase assembly protein COX18, mitochondrial isoform X3 n=1 Tax=Myodes glareolus TaxID=447135 RepID=UPI002020E108|nr:cytochrome c oxidase assembly protein COX18, mitochondrial isoform X3 [Myodes glareolus]
MRTSSVGPLDSLPLPVCSAVAMLCRQGAGCLRSLPTLRLRARGLQPGRSSLRLQALPVWAAASVSAAAPGGWYEALAASAPVRAAEEVLLGAQAATGLPWWGSIMLTTVALRGAVTLPLAAYQHYILAKVENLQPEIKSIAKRLNQEVAVCAHQFGWSKRVARLTYLKNMRRLVSELYVRDNCHPFKATVLVWVQLPMWVFISVALRNFSTGAAHSEDFRSTKTRNVSFSDVCHTLCARCVRADDPDRRHSTFFSSSLLAVFQPLGPLPESAAALPGIPPSLPDTNNQVGFRDPLQRPLCCLLCQVPFKKMTAMHFLQ